MKITLPTAEVGKAIMEASKDSMVVKGIFIAYDVDIKGNRLTLTAKDGYTESAEDAFLLAWYVKEYI
ncbi:hypothetical protein [Sphingobacterium sp. UBA6320]|uniref:hypothetical protein n=1 Tax=Sphingobacterium sp. UBA6320 TaxID=1947510 RepID=UPI0025F1DFB5|nr:hypothetical protein [Sphingobacterium sp. UBA6320]